MELEKGAQELGRGVAVDVEDLDDARVLDGHGCGEPSEAIGRRPAGKRPSRLLDFFASRVDARPSSAPRHNNNVAPRQTLPRCDVHAGHLLRACRPTAAMWRVLGAHVAGFHPNTPTPKTTARRLRRLFERAAAATVRLRAVLGGPRARQWHELAPAGARRTRRPTGGSVQPPN